MAKITGYVKVPSNDFWEPWAKPAIDGLPFAIIAETIGLIIPELYFYGSRSKSFIKVDDTNSDWDFAFENNPIAVAELLANGFVRKDLDGYSYADGLTFECYEKEIGGHKVQLVSKGNLEVFKDIWDGIDDGFWQTYICKKSPSYMGKDGVTRLISTFKYMIECAISKPLEDLI